MRITSLSTYQRDGKRLAQIVGVLIRYGLAERLEKLEPEFVKRWLHHEDVGDLARAPIGERVRRACEELGPAFIKLGQILSTRPDIIPRDIARALQELQSNAPPSPIDDVVALIEEDLDAPLDELFASFDRTPLASASIGQVHRAVLRNGTRVVVKAQHPGIEERIRVDLNILLHLAHFAEEHDPALRAYGPVDLAKNAKRTLLRELDFRRELRNQQAFERNFADDPEVYVPATYAERSGPRVLTMEYVEGYSIGQHARLVADGHDPAALARTGADAFLSMVFVDRLFHADPHPGNVFVQPDGRLALLDFGMVGRLDEDLLDDLLDLLIGFVGGDARGITRAVAQLGSVPGDCNLDDLRRDLAELQAEVGDTPFDELDAARLLDEFAQLVRTHRIRLPATIALLIKVLVMLDGTSRELDRSFSLIELLRPYCDRAIRKRHSPRAQLRRAIETSRDWSRLMGRLPRTLDDLARRLQARNLSVDLEHRGLEATVDRLVSGLLCASMLLGGSILWALAAPPTVWGVSVLGVLATVIAVLHGIRILSKLGRR